MSIVMLPVPRIARVKDDPIQVIGLFDAESDSQEDQWLALDLEGKPHYYLFSEVKFDGWSI